MNPNLTTFAALALAALHSCGPAPVRATSVLGLQRLSWGADNSDKNPWQGRLFSGETAVLSAELRNNGGPVFVPAGTPAGFWWQHSSMPAELWHSLPASAAPNGVLSATFKAPAPGNVRFFFRLGAADAVNYTVNGRLQILPSPGANPEEVPLPTPRLDFAQVEVFNAPWLPTAEGEEWRAESRQSLDGATNELWQSVGGATNALAQSITETARQADTAWNMATYAAQQSGEAAWQAGEARWAADNAYSYATGALNEALATQAMLERVVRVGDPISVTNGNVDVESGNIRAGGHLRGRTIAIGQNYSPSDTGTDWTMDVNGFVRNGYPGNLAWPVWSAAGARFATSEDTAKLVPATRTINGKPLAGNITITAADIGPVPAPSLTIQHFDFSIADVIGPGGTGYWRLPRNSCVLMDADDFSPSGDFGFIMESADAWRPGDRAKIQWRVLKGSRADLRFRMESAENFEGEVSDLFEWAEPQIAGAPNGVLLTLTLDIETVISGYHHEIPPVRFVFTKTLSIGSQF